MSEARPTGLLLRPSETGHRLHGGDDYVIVVHPTLAESRQLNDLAVVVHTQADGNHPRAYGRICLDSNLARDEIRMDQKLRNAIGTCSSCRCSP